MQSRIEQTPKVLPKRLISRIVIGSSIVLLVVQVIVSNQLATQGLELSDMDQKARSLKEENLELSQEIASLSALSTVEVRAHELGLINKVDPLYLTKEPAVAVELH